MSRTPRKLVAICIGLMAVLLWGQAAQAKTVVVHRGDTLSGIVYRECGTSNWSQAARDNASTNPNPNLIYAGQTLQINCGGSTAAPAAAAPAQSSSGWFDPLPGHGWGNCNYWEWRGSYNHRGEDIMASYGTPIHAAAAGTVTTAWQSGAGNYTVIKHSDGSATVYMHQSSFAVRSGWVNGNQVIGYVGATGNASGPHLHFEVQPWGPWNGVTNPIQWLRDRGVSVGC